MEDFGIETENQPKGGTTRFVFSWRDVLIVGVLVLAIVMSIATGRTATSVRALSAEIAAVNTSITQSHESVQSEIGGLATATGAIELDMDSISGTVVDNRNKLNNLASTLGTVSGKVDTLTGAVADINEMLVAHNWTALEEMLAACNCTALFEAVDELANSVARIEEMLVAGGNWTAPED